MIDNENLKARAAQVARILNWLANTTKHTSEWFDFLSSTISDDEKYPDRLKRLLLNIPHEVGLLQELLSILEVRREGLLDLVSIASRANYEREREKQAPVDVPWEAPPHGEIAARIEHHEASLAAEATKRRPGRPRKPRVEPELSDMTSALGLTESDVQGAPEPGVEPEREETLDEAFERATGAGHDQ